MVLLVHLSAYCKILCILKTTSTSFHIPFYFHLGYSFNDIVLIQLSPFHWGIPLPGSVIVGKNQSAELKPQKFFFHNLWFYPLRQLFSFQITY